MPTSTGGGTPEGGASLDTVVELLTLLRSDVRETQADTRRTREAHEALAADVSEVKDYLEEANLGPGHSEGRDESFGRVSTFGHAARHSRGSGAQPGGDIGSGLKRGISVYLDPMAASTPRHSYVDPEDIQNVNNEDYDDDDEHAPPAGATSSNMPSDSNLGRRDTAAAAAAATGAAAAAAAGHFARFSSADADPAAGATSESGVSDEKADSPDSAYGKPAHTRVGRGSSATSPRPDDARNDGGKRQGGGKGSTTRAKVATPEEELLAAEKELAEAEKQLRQSQSAGESKRRSNTDNDDKKDSRRVSDFRRTSLVTNFINSVSGTTRRRSTDAGQLVETPAKGGRRGSKEILRSALKLGAGKRDSHSDKSASEQPEKPKKTDYANKRKSLTQDGLKRASCVSALLHSSGIKSMTRKESTTQVLAAQQVQGDRRSSVEGQIKSFGSVKSDGLVHDLDDVEGLLTDLREAEKTGHHHHSSQEIEPGYAAGLCGLIGCECIPMMSPDTRGRQRWDMYMLLLVVFSCLLTPMILAWPSDFMPVTAWVAVTLVIDAVFAADIVVKFHTGIKVDGALTMDPQVVASCYLQRFFWLDLVAAIPFYALSTVWAQDLDDPDDASRTNVMLRLLQLTKLLRLVQMWRTFESLASYQKVNPSYVRLSKLLLFLVLAWHWIGCVYWFVGELPDGIVRAYASVAELSDCEKRWGPALVVGDDVDLGSQYLYCLWWAISVASGLGDVQPPENNAQSAFTVCVTFFGLITNAVMISHLSSALANIDAAAVQRRQKLDALKLYLRYRRVPANLQLRIVGYYEYLWSRVQTLNDKDMLGELPNSLQLQLALVLNRALFTRVPIFREMETNCIVAFVQNLRPFICLPGQLVLKQGTKASALCFVNRGTLQKIYNGLATGDTLRENDFFGEQSLIFDRIATQGVRSLEYCELMYLHKSDFERVLQKFPSLRTLVLEHAERAQKDRERRRQSLDTSRSSRHVGLRRISVLANQRRGSVGTAGADAGEQRPVGRRNSTGLSGHFPIRRGSCGSNHPCEASGTEGGGAFARAATLVLSRMSHRKVGDGETSPLAPAPAAAAGARPSSSQARLGSGSSGDALTGIVPGGGPSSAEVAAAGDLPVRCGGLPAGAVCGGKLPDGVQAGGNLHSSQRWADTAPEVHTDSVQTVTSGFKDPDAAPSIERRMSDERRSASPQGGRVRRECRPVGSSGSGSDMEGAIVSGAQAPDRKSAAPGRRACFGSSDVKVHPIDGDQ